MATRPRRPQYQPGNYYHLFNRGARQLRIFREEENYIYVIKQMNKYYNQLELTIIAYSLLPNHYHLLVRQDGENSAGLFPQRVFNSYSKAYNKRYDHSGTLFEGSYKVIEITTENHLRHLCRYNHVNPVKDGFVMKPEDWLFSNYRDWVGLRAGTMVDHGFIETFFGMTESYRKFVSDYLEDLQLQKELVGYLEGY